MSQITRQQLCAELSISESTVRRLEREGMPHTGEGRALRFDAAACKAWVKDRYTKAEPSPRDGAIKAFEGKTMRETQFIRHAIVRTPGQPLTHGRHFGRSQEAVMPLLLGHIPATRTKRWREAVVAELSPVLDDPQERDDFRECVMDMALVPDAYLINADAQELHFFEVEVSSPMSRSKLQSFAKFLTDLHYYGITFAVFTVNQHGHINEVHLLPHYLDWLESVSGRKGPGNE